MSIYKIHRGADGRVKSLGPDVEEFQPYLEDGDTLEFADEPPPPTLEDQLAAIEAEYEQKQAELDKALVAALRMGGAQEAAARAAIKQKSLKLIQDQNDEIDALSAQQNGG
jgi:hypothetical protein|nr:MAG TPA: hypothetical protein [Bacteriophage sp.]